MKIGLVKLTHGTGGIDRYADSLFAELSRSYPQTSFRLVTTGNSSGRLKNPLEENLKSPRTPFFSQSLSLLSLRNQYNLLHFTAHLTTPVFLSLRSKIVMTIHGLDHFLFPPEFQLTPVSPTIRWLSFASIRYFQRYIAAFVVVSQDTKKLLMKFLKIPEEKIYVIPHGVDSEIFKSLSNQREARKELKQRLGIRFPYLLHVSRRQPLKNVPRILEAFVKFLEGAPSLGDYSLVIAGESGRDENEILRKIKEFHLEEKVIFLNAVTEDALLAKLYSCADLFVFPSLYESFALPVLESMSCGTPVVTSNVGGIPEIAGDACLYADPRHSSQIAEAMARILKNQTLRSRCVEKGRRQAENLSWKRCADRHVQLYESLLNKVLGTGPKGPATNGLS